MRTRQEISVLPGGGSIPAGIALESIKALFAPAFLIDRQETGDDPRGPSSAWYWLQRRSKPRG